MFRPAIFLLTVVFLAISTFAYGQATEKKPWKVLEERIVNAPPGEQGKIIQHTNALGLKFYKKRDYLSALEYFMVAVRFSENHFYFSNAANSAINLGNREQGAGFFKKAVAASIKVKAYQSIKKYNRNINSIKSILPNTPEIKKVKLQWDNFNKQIVSLYRKGRYQEAAENAGPALGIARKNFGGNHPHTLTSIHFLGFIFQSQGLYAKAQPLYEEALRRTRKVLGENHPKTINLMNKLAKLYRSQGRYAKAQTLYEEALQGDRKILGENHSDTLISMNNLGSFYQSQAQYSKALALYKEALRRRQKVLGEYNSSTLISMNNLAMLYKSKGLYAKAQPLYEETLRRRQMILGENHPSTLTSMNNLGELFNSQGLYAKAQPLYEDTLRRRRKVLGGNHPDTLASMNNLAMVYPAQGLYAKAQALFEEALRRTRKILGENHPTTMTIINNLGMAYQAQNLYAKAQPLIEEALRRRRKILGESHPSTLTSMNNLGVLYESQGQHGKALPLYEETFWRFRRVLGENHPNTLASMKNLIMLSQSMGAWKNAASLWRQYLLNKNRFLDQVLWAADENTRQSYLSQERAHTDDLLSFYRAQNTPASAREALVFSLTRKGLLLKVSSEVKALVRASANPALKSKATELSALRQESAQRTLAGPGRMKPEAYHARMRELAERIGRLEADLGRSVQQIARGRKAVTPEQVVKALGADAVLVDFLAYRERDPKNLKAKRNKLLAVVVAPSRDPPITLVPLGDLDPIAGDIKALRALLSEPTPKLPPKLSALAKSLYARLWKPLVPYIMDQRTIYLVPDGPLHVLPFPALMDAQGKFLAETQDLTVLSSSRDLVLPPPSGKTSAPAIVSAPNYDHPEQAVAANDRTRGTKTRGVKLADIHFSPLPGTVTEGRLIVEMLRGKGQIPRALSGGAASERAVAGLVRPEILHLATHGFFLDDLPSGDGKAGPRRGLGVIARLNPGSPGGINRPRPVGNPLARSGLALAGANLGTKGKKQADGTDGILTAMEVLSMDLAGTRLVVLSACETGLGDIRQGEGVYGLRRAFQEAGAAAVLSTLWQVDDAGTQAFMTSFYTRFLQGKGAQESARAVQREFIASTRWRHPFYWAPFVMVGVR